MAVKKAEQSEVTIPALRMAKTRFRIVGTMPLFQNRMAEKAKQTLLIGGRKKTAADKANIKHNPPEEFRSSMETMRDGPTVCGMRTVAIKKAMAQAALETPGITKSSVGRLIFIPGELTPLYGIPRLRMDVVRSADVNRTPDIRTRAYFERWCCEVEVHHVIPQLPVSSVAALIYNAGIMIGLGDFRQEKGAGAYGVFRVIPDGEDDAEWDDLVANEGRDAQLDAIADPEFAGPDTEDLMQHFADETARRAA